MRTLLICHAEDDLDRTVLPRWLSSFSRLTGIIVLRERSAQRRARIGRELRRVGAFRFLDVVAFRLYYRLFLASADRRRMERMIADGLRDYPAPPKDVPVLETHSINTSAARDFVAEVAPDIMIARCKQLIKKEVFTIPSTGTFVMHPGICPEYRNAHGCFWALASDDVDNVGMTLLQIDEGVDTGPIYGQFGCSVDEVEESHAVIQARVVFENLSRVRDALRAVHRGEAPAISTEGRRSEAWGQPWLTEHLRWKRRARRRRSPA